MTVREKMSGRNCSPSRHYRKESRTSAALVTRRVVSSIRAPSGVIEVQHGRRIRLPSKAFLTPVVRRARLILAFGLPFALLASFSVGCSETSVAPSSTTTATVTAVTEPNPGSSPIPLPMATIPVPPIVEQVVAAGKSQDATALTSLLKFQAVRCTSQTPQGIGGQPACGVGVADGTVYELLLVMGCEGSWGDRRVAESAVRDGLARAHDLYAAAVLLPDPTWPSDVVYGKYVVVFAPSNGQQLDSLAVYLDDSGIVRLQLGCSLPERRIRLRGTGPVFPLLIPPQGPLPPN